MDSSVANGATRSNGWGDRTQRETQKTPRHVWEILSLGTKDTTSGRLDPAATTGTAAEPGSRRIARVWPAIADRREALCPGRRRSWASSWSLSAFAGASARIERGARRIQGLIRRGLAAGWSVLRDQVLAPLIEGLLPAPCPGCREPLPGFARGGLCGRCWRSIVRVSPPLCVRCGTPFPPALDRVSPALERPCAACARRPPAYDGARCALVYEDAVRTLLHLFKFDHRADLARHLAPEVVRALPEDAAFDLVVPVPLHWTRRLRRGYNQAALLARRVGRATGTPCRHVLVKRRRTRDQSTLDAGERRRNLTRAFAVRTPLFAWLRGAAARRRWHASRSHSLAALRASCATPGSERDEPRRSPVAGARVLLIDDILTTGATAEECARVLKAAGAASVFVAAVARTPLHGSARSGSRD